MTETTRPSRAELPAYDPATIERKWQARWDERGTNDTDVEHGARNYYALMMFPYPSAEGLHVGNLFAFTRIFLPRITRESYRGVLSSVRHELA